MVGFRLSSSFPPNWKLSLRCYSMFITSNSLVSAPLGIVFLCCKVFEIVKVGSSTLLAELFFQHSSNLVGDVRVADICVAWLVYIRTYCVPIATLNQNKKSQLLYFGPCANRKCFKRITYIIRWKRNWKVEHEVLQSRHLNYFYEWTRLKSCHVAQRWDRDQSKYAFLARSQE